MQESRGQAYYSRILLSVAGPQKGTDWNWPSIDHVETPGVASVVLETRLVNDMKTIMSQQEFREMIGHLASVLTVQAADLRQDWHCKRSFAIEQPDEEPALPE